MKHMDVGSFEWWHVFISMVGILVTIGFLVLGSAFRAWGNRLGELKIDLSGSLAKMSNLFGERLDKIEGKVDVLTADLRKDMLSHERATHVSLLRLTERIAKIEARTSKVEDKI